MKIAVAGATGRVGGPLVEILEVRGHTVVPMARAKGVDIIGGAGLAQALGGVSCIVDASSSPSPEQQAATRFFTTAARNLQQAGARAGVAKIVMVSIIGIDRFRAGYMAAKIAHERAMNEGPLPVQILRAAQFHEFVAQLVEWGKKGDASYVPKMRVQLVAARSVAEALADMAIDPARAPSPHGAIPEIAGPSPGDMVDKARELVARRGGPARIEAADNRADPDRDAYENGALLPGPNAMLAGPTFERWLEQSS